jgi:hypothetical protein
MMTRRLVVMLVMSAAMVGCGAIVNYLLNPYGVWETRLIDPVFRKPKDEHVALPYLIRSARAHTLLVGSSRVALGMRIDEIEGDGVLNGGIRAATIPQSCAIIRTALENRHFRRVIWASIFPSMKIGRTTIASSSGGLRAASEIGLKTRCSAWRRWMTAGPT